MIIVIYHSISEENQNKNFYFIYIFFRKSYRLWDNVEKYVSVGQAIGNSTVHAYCLLDT
jgi:hypothetical protein